MLGKIIKWDREDEFGFIEGTDGDEYFLHFSAVAYGANNVKVDDVVIFEIITMDTGLHACNTKKVTKEEEDNYRQAVVKRITDEISSKTVELQAFVSQ